jgi:hypothetical protein
MAAKDRLVAQLEIAQTKWGQSDETAKMELLRPFVNAGGMTVFSKKRFEYLPEVLQLILSLFWMENDSLNDLAVAEGYLDHETRLYVHRNIVIAAVAGSINRGSTATETSAYRRTGNTRWSKSEGT